MPGLLIGWDFEIHQDDVTEALEQAIDAAPESTDAMIEIDAPYVKVPGPDANYQMLIKRCGGSEPAVSILVFPEHWPEHPVLEVEIDYVSARLRENTEDDAEANTHILKRYLSSHIDASPEFYQSVGNKLAVIFDKESIQHALWQQTIQASGPVTVPEPSQDGGEIEPLTPDQFDALQSQINEIAGEQEAMMQDMDERHQATIAPRSPNATDSLAFFFRAPAAGKWTKDETDRAAAMFESVQPGPHLH